MEVGNGSIHGAGGRIRTCELCPPQSRALSLITNIAESLTLHNHAPESGPLADFIEILGQLKPGGCC